MNENSIEVVRKLSLVGHSGEVLFYRGLRVLKGISDTNVIKDLLSFIYLTLKTCRAQPISFNIIQFYYSFWDT